jgi:hypothetical protein
MPFASVKHPLYMYRSRDEGAGHAATSRWCRGDAFAIKERARTLVTAREEARMMNRDQKSVRMQRKTKDDKNDERV